MKRVHKILAIAVASLAFAGAARAGNNLPPAGPVVLNLAGQALPTVYTQYATSFVASSTSSVITFVFRHDPGWYAFDDASVSTGGGANLLSDPGFEDSGMGAWSYFAQAGVSHTGFVGVNGEGVGDITFFAPVHSGAHDWLDGSTEGYDGLTQTISTVAGKTYDISFYLDQQLTQPVTATNFQAISTNGQSGVLGNGIDVLVYAGAGPPSTTEPLGVPEPSTWALMMVGVGLAGAGLRRRRVGVQA